MGAGRGGARETQEEPGLVGNMAQSPQARRRQNEGQRRAGTSEASGARERGIAEGMSLRERRRGRRGLWAGFWGQGPREERNVRESWRHPREGNGRVPTLKLHGEKGGARARWTHCSAMM